LSRDSLTFPFIMAPFLGILVCSKQSIEEQW
jgi:hypothetical protein